MNELPKTVTNRNEAYHYFRGLGYSMAFATREAAEWTIWDLWERATKSKNMLTEAHLRLSNMLEDGDKTDREQGVAFLKKLAKIVK